MTKEVTIDQLLSRQQEVKSLATIESVDSNPELVKVTPWVQAQGCLCTSSLIIPKATVASVTLTGDIRYCCGKRLEVVEITFKEDAQISVADVFEQTAATVSLQRNSHKNTSSSDTISQQLLASRMYQVPGGLPNFLSSVMTSSKSMPEMLTDLRPCRPTCMCWPDGCLCYNDCT